MFFYGFQPLVTLNSVPHVPILTQDFYEFQWITYAFLWMSKDFHGFLRECILRYVLKCRHMFLSLPMNSWLSSAEGGVKELGNMVFILFFTLLHIDSWKELSS